MHACTTTHYTITDVIYYSGKRQLSGIESEVIEAARRGANCCDAVLRGVAQSVLELIN